MSFPCYWSFTLFPISRMPFGNLLQETETICSLDLVSPLLGKCLKETILRGHQRIICNCVRLLKDFNIEQWKKGKLCYRNIIKLIKVAYEKFEIR